MFINLFFVLSYVLSVESNKLIFKPENLYKTCHFNKVDFWKFYYWMFQNYDHMHISTFEIEHESAILQRFLNEILASVADHGLLQKSFTVNNYMLQANEIRNYCPNIPSSNENSSDLVVEERRLNRLCQDNLIENAQCPPVANTTAKIQFVTLEEILAEVMAKVKPRNESDIQQRIRSFSCDQNYRYFILVQNEDDLRLHLEKHWTAVFPNSRAIFVIMFVTVDEMSAEKIEDLFERLWQDYDVFNLIITQPCVCNYKDLYTYDPYYKENDTWGLLKKFKVDDGINNPENYRRSLVDLNDHPLKISLFSKIPTSSNQFPKVLRDNPIYGNLEKSLGFIGLDGMILKTLAELLKLSPEIGSQETDFGYEMNGQFYGNLGEVVNRSIDISFNSRFVEGVGLDVIEYLTPVLNDRFCIIVPKALEIPQYLMIFQCFTWRSWLIIFMIYLVSSFYWFLVRPIEFNPKKGEKEFVLSYMEVFCLFLSVPMKLLVERNHQRVFFVTCMIFNIIVIGCFQGTLVKSFSTTSHYSDINTLEDFERSGLYIISSSQGVHNLFGDDGSAFFKKLSSKIKIIPKLANIFKRVSTKRDIASVDRYADATLKIEMNYKTKHGSLLHIVKECPRSYHYTYIVPKGSPYVHVFNIIITVLREAGLLLKWTADITEALITEMKYKHKDKEESTPDMEQPFSMDDMRFSFYVIIGGNSLAIFVFILEVIFNTRCCKKLKKCNGCRRCKKEVDKDKKVPKKKEGKEKFKKSKILESFTKGVKKSNKDKGSSNKIIKDEGVKKSDKVKGFFRKNDKGKEFFKKSLKNKELWKKSLRNKEILKKSVEDEGKRKVEDKDILKTLKDKDIMKKSLEDQEVSKKTLKDKEDLKKTLKDKEDLKKTLKDKEILKKTLKDKEIFKKTLKDKDVLKKSLKDKEILQKSLKDKKILKETLKDKDILKETLKDKEISSVEDKEILNKSLKENELLKNGTKNNEILNEGTSVLGNQESLKQSPIKLNGSVKDDKIIQKMRFRDRGIFKRSFMRNKVFFRRNNLRSKEILNKETLKDDKIFKKRNLKNKDVKIFKNRFSIGKPRMEKSNNKSSDQENLNDSTKRTLDDSEKKSFDLRFRKNNLGDINLGKNNLADINFGKINLAGINFGKNNLADLNFGKESFDVEKFGKRNLTRDIFDKKSLDKRNIDITSVKKDNFDKTHPDEVSKRYPEENLDMKHPNDKNKNSKSFITKLFGQKENKNDSDEENFGYGEFLP